MKSSASEPGLAKLLAKAETKAVFEKVHVNYILIPFVNQDGPP